MVYFLTMYERQDYQILDQLVNQMEGDVTSPPPDPKTWRGKASQWMQPGEPRTGARSTSSTNGALTDIAKSCFQNLSVWCLQCLP